MGYLVNVCKILDTRKQLAAREGIADSVGCCEMCCCLSCYVGQELAHIQASGPVSGQPKF